MTKTKLNQTQKNNRLFKRSIKTREEAARQLQEVYVREKHRQTALEAAVDRIETLKDNRRILFGLLITSVVLNMLLIYGRK